MPVDPSPQQSIPITIVAPGEIIFKPCSPPGPCCPSVLGIPTKTYRRPAVVVEEIDPADFTFASAEQRKLVQEWIVKIIRTELFPYLEAAAAELDVTVSQNVAKEINKALLKRAVDRESAD